MRGSTCKEKDEKITQELERVIRMKGRRRGRYLYCITSYHDVHDVV